MTPSDIAPCPVCGHALHFDTDLLGHLLERCDQCWRNRERARLGLPALRLIDARPLPPPTDEERAEYDARRQLDDDTRTGALAAAYRAGDSTVVLGTRYGVRPQWIRKRLLKAGVTMRLVGCGLVHLNLKRRAA